MTTFRADLSIDDVLADPMIRIVMRADGVEPRDLEAMLRALAAARSPAGRFWADWYAHCLPSPRLAAGSAGRR